MVRANDVNKILSKSLESQKCFRVSNACPAEVPRNVWHKEMLKNHVVTIVLSKNKNAMFSNPPSIKSYDRAL